jgi:hypothetical protein
MIEAILGEEVTRVERQRRVVVAASRRLFERVDVDPQFVSVEAE